MTAEIAIINRSAVALAADSALTVRRGAGGKERVWKNTNKLFSLSSYNDIGIMIYNTGDFCGVSWEIVIKQFRKEIKKTVFDTLDSAVLAFQEFLHGFKSPTPDLDILNILIIFIQSLEQCINSSTSSRPVKKRHEMVACAESLISELSISPIIYPDLTIKNFSEEYKHQVKEFIEEKGIRATNDLLSKITRLCFERTRRQYESSFETGVVFAGYGKNEIFPAVKGLIVDGKSASGVRVWTDSEQNLNKKDAPSAIIQPYGQSDIAYLFMEGLQLDYLDFIKKTIKGFLDEKSRRIVDEYVPPQEKLVEKERQLRDNKLLVEAFSDEFRKMREAEAIEPMLTVVSALPKEEMAAMAEALVEITSLRRKIDSHLETVGGPVDVAIISKSDGFVWIKRKHYFDLDLNPDFMARRNHRFGEV